MFLCVFVCVKCQLENRDIRYEMYCNFCFGDAHPKNNLLISNFTIFKSLLFEGYSCKRLQTLYTY
jgi:hypothetical protein